MKLSSSFFGICLVFLVGCISPPTAQISSNQTNLPTSSQISPQKIKLDETVKIVMGQTIYVPIYSEIHHFKGRTLPLAATLSVRNSDPHNSIIITSVNYYNSHGELVKQYLDSPLKLVPLASTDFVVEQDDRTGGSGANFLVEWVAETKVYEPIVEAVMVSTTSQQGISFVSQGRVIESKSATVPNP